MGDWRYAGGEQITNEGDIKLPDRLFEENILDDAMPVVWSFERDQGFVLLSNENLEDDKYKKQGITVISGEPGSYRATIRKEFFEDYVGSGRGEAKSPVPEKAQVQYYENRFFAYRDPMATDKKRSCYMFDWEEFDNTIGDDDWADPLDEIPRFS